MISANIVCDGCKNNICATIFGKNSLKEFQETVKSYGWKPIKEGLYCPECQSRLKVVKEYHV